MKDRPEGSAKPRPKPDQQARAGDTANWPAGTTEADRRCWVCGGPTSYHHCKIQCRRCGFMRDCSDP